MKQIKHLCLTGGPCGGKTTALAYLSEKLADRGWRVLIAPEIPTFVIGGGLGDLGQLRQDHPGVYHRIEESMMALQHQWNVEYGRIEAALPDEKIVRIDDRGIRDAAAYLEDETFAAIVAERGWSLTDLGDHYDGVFHLVSAAVGAESFYTTANNAARLETVDEAREADARTQAAWVGHPHLRVVDNSTDFDGKLRRLLASVARTLGEPVPLEIERKYHLAALPDLDHLVAIGARKIEIKQTYLGSENGDGWRVRRRTQGGQSAYYETIKREAGGLSRHEVERLIGYTEYRDLLERADPTRHPIIKDRWCFLWQSQYFELDVIPRPDGSVLILLEIELTEENDRVELPPFVEVIEEVSEQPEYRNANLALRSR
jgi:CYTH domain-containing protein/predicted ATPase